jgi:hypothetical protein
MASGASSPEQLMMVEVKQQCQTNAQQTHH